MSRAYNLYHLLRAECNCESCGHSNERDEEYHSGELFNCLSCGEVVRVSEATDDFI